VEQIWLKIIIEQKCGKGRSRCGIWRMLAMEGLGTH